MQDPSTTNAETLLMLGQDHRHYGTFSQRSLGRVTACLSVGSDHDSPSLVYKGDPDQPNEDALLVRRCRQLYLLAVSDAHFGIESSHRLMQRLSQAEFPQSRTELLKLCLEIQKPHEKTASEATLVVALYDESSGRVLALSTGDSTLAVLGQSGWNVQNVSNREYVRLDRLSSPGSWHAMELYLEPGSVLVLHTDGVDECHYRHPQTSLKPAHIEALWTGLPIGSPTARLPLFCAALTQAAMDGVDDQPGGQDNIAVLALVHTPEPGG